MLILVTACARSWHHSTFISSEWSVPVLIMASASLHRNRNTEQRSQCNYNPNDLLEAYSCFSTLSSLAHCCSGFSQASTLRHHDSWSMELWGRTRGHIPLPLPLLSTYSWLFSFADTPFTSLTTFSVPTDAPPSSGSWGGP